MKRKFIHIILFLLAICTVYANEAERIQQFHTDIVIDTTGRIEVIESITVYAKGINIQRGIVRSIPLYRTDKYGNKIKMDFTVLSVTRDGEKEPYTTDIYKENKEIYIGDEYITLDPGIYQYTITYEAYGHIGFFKTSDELYWNVTGNDWYFNIDTASASITLPEGASMINTACYTGWYGETNEDCSFQEQNGKYEFATNGQLKKREGFTIAIAFTPHIIKRPAFWERCMNEYPYLIYSAIALLVLICFYIITRLIVRKGLKKKPVIPTFDPPNGWSASTIRLLYKKKHDKKVLMVALIEMAVRKLIRIRQEKNRSSSGKKKYVLEKTNTKGIATTTLENKILDLLFYKDETTISVSDRNRGTFSAIDRTINASFQEYEDQVLPKKSSGYIIVGIFLKIAILLTYLNLFTSLSFEYIGLLLLFFIIALFSILSLMEIHLNKNRRYGRGFKIFFASIIFLLIVIQLIIYQVLGLSLLQISFIFLLILLTPVYCWLMKTPTQQGLDIDNMLKGFRMYLSTAEENRLNLLTPPEHTPELFEKLLPYAIALDVENAWGKKFDNVLKRIDYSPDWYVGVSTSNISVFTDSLSHSFNSSIPHTKIPTTRSSGGWSGSSGSSGSGSWGSGTGSSGSGSSGGGYSGGGGGGGGGRGW